MKNPEEQRLYYVTNMGRAYTPEELEKTNDISDLRNDWEVLQANGFRMNKLISKWRAYFFDGGQMPKRNLHHHFQPGRNPNNNMCVFVDELFDLYSQYEHGGVPVVVAAAVASQIELANLAALSEIYDSPDLQSATIELKNLFSMLGYLGEPLYSKEQFNKLLRKSFDAYLEYITNYLREFHQMFLVFKKTGKMELPSPASRRDVEEVVSSAEKIIRSEVKAATEVVTRIDNRTKRMAKEYRGTIPIAVQDQCFTIWENGKKNSSVKMNGESKTKHEHVFVFYKKELRAIGITSAEEFHKAINARNKRFSRTSSSSKQI